MKAEEKKLLDFLSDGNATFYIPPYQRNYEWTSEQCERFFDDIYDIWEKNRDCDGDDAKICHFFGTITYMRTIKQFGQPDELILIDGQQRITTMMLLLVAIRDMLHSNDTRDWITKQYLVNHNAFGDQMEKIKLKQVEKDRTSYQNIISHNFDQMDKGSYVYRNYLYFLNRIRKAFREDGEIISFLSLGLQECNLIAIQLEPERNSWENPQEIFESMNSLGKPLSLADLVRNYLLLGFDSETQEAFYHDYWVKMEETLPKQLTNYIRDYMQWKLKDFLKIATPANYKELYALFRSKIAPSRDDAEIVLYELNDNADLYACIAFANQSTGNQKIDQFLADFRTIKYTTARSFLLVLLSTWRDGDFEDADIIDIIDILHTYCLRRTICGIRQLDNQLFPRLVKRIPDLQQAPDKRQKMFEIIDAYGYSYRFPGYNELTQQLKTMEFGYFAYAPFYLSLVEEKLSGYRPGSVFLSHIMPEKNLTREWQQDLGDDAEAVQRDLAQNLGNLTLTYQDSKIFSTFPFAEKRNIYLSEGLQISQEGIGDQQHWDRVAIMRRRDWLADFIAKEVLPIPNETTQPQKNRLSFEALCLIGKTICFHRDPTIKAVVVSDNEVRFEGKIWRMSPLTAEIMRRRGEINPSGTYQGAQYWEYDGILLRDLL